MTITAIFMKRDSNGQLNSTGLDIEATSKTSAIKQAKEYAKAHNVRYYGYNIKPSYLKLQEVAPMKIEASFYTITDNLFKRGVYSSMKRARAARERYELQYGACLRMVTREVA